MLVSLGVLVVGIESASPAECTETVYECDVLVLIMEYAKPAGCSSLRPTGGAGKL